MKIYCQECGSPLEYIDKKPNFCGDCGYNFITKASQASSPPSQSKQALDNDPEENDVKELDPRIYEMSGLDVDITIAKPQKITLGELFPQESQGRDEEKTNKK